MNRIKSDLSWLQVTICIIGGDITLSQLSFDPATLTLHPPIF